MEIEISEKFTAQRIYITTSKCENYIRIDYNPVINLVQWFELIQPTPDFRLISCHEAVDYLENIYWKNIDSKTQ